jgi:hypothetical protein
MGTPKGDGGDVGVDCEAIVKVFAPDASKGRER